MRKARLLMFALVLVTMPLYVYASVQHKTPVDDGGTGGSSCATKCSTSAAPRADGSGGGSCSSNCSGGLCASCTNFDHTPICTCSV